MKFFVPVAQSEAEAESVLNSIAQFNSTTVPERRIFRMKYSHQGKDMVAEVGRPADLYYREGDQPVVAILPVGRAFAICLPTRGVAKGGPILASTESVTDIEYFDATK